MSANPGDSLEEGTIKADVARTLAEDTALHAEWETFCLSLGIPQGDINNIRREVNTNQTFSTTFLHILDYWVGRKGARVANLNSLIVVLDKDYSLTAGKLRLLQVRPDRRPLDTTTSAGSDAAATSTPKSIRLLRNLAGYRKHYPTIVVMTNVDDILDVVLHLYSKGVLTDNQKQAILKTDGKVQSNHLWECLGVTPEEKWETLKNVLSELGFSHIAKLLCE